MTPHVFFMCIYVGCTKTMGIIPQYILSMSIILNINATSKSCPTGPTQLNPAWSAIFTFLLVCVASANSFWIVFYDIFSVVLDVYGGVSRIYA